MSFLGNVLGMPLGYAIFFIYGIVKNYGLSIIIFTVLLKLVLVPLFLKQQKATARLGAFKPLIDEINKKYAKNPKKKNEELQKLYLSNNMNPIAGFLPMLLPFFVLFGMINVIYQPLTYILHITPEVKQQALEISGMFDNVANSHRHGPYEINLINEVINHPQKYEALGSNFVDSVSSINLNFLGFNLGHVANLTSISILIPILAFVFSFLQSIIMLKFNGMQQGGSVIKIMLFIGPIMSFFIALSVPIGVSIYWITSYILQIFQSLLFNKFFNFEQIKKDAILEFERIRKNKKSSGKIGNAAKISNKERIGLARKRLEQMFDD